MTRSPTRTMRQSQQANTHRTIRNCGNELFHVPFAMILLLAHISVDIATVMYTPRVHQPSLVRRRDTDSCASARRAAPDKYQNHHHLQARTPKSPTETPLVRLLKSTMKMITKTKTTQTMNQMTTTKPTNWRWRKTTQKQVENQAGNHENELGQTI